jgi:hypothetical protein
VEDAITNLDPNEVRDFKKILDNVRTQTIVSRMEKEGRMTKKRGDSQTAP